MTLTNNNIASVRTAAPVTWGTGVGLLVEGVTDLQPAAVLFISAVAMLIIHRVGTELQQMPNRWAKVVGDILMWVDKAPVYETPPAPELPKD